MRSNTVVFMATQYQTAKTGCTSKTWTYTFTVMSRTLLPIKLLCNNGVEDRIWTYEVHFWTADLSLLHLPLCHFYMADRVRFELTSHSHDRRYSKPLHLPTLSPIRMAGCIGFEPMNHLRDCLLSRQMYSATLPTPHSVHSFYVRSERNGKE